MGSSTSGVGSSSSNGSIGAGIDVASTVAALMQSERLPETQMQNQITSLNTKTAALTSINSSLSSLLTSIQNLTSTGTRLSGQNVSSSNSSVLTATSDGTAMAISHQITVANLASTSSQYTNAVGSSSTALATGSFSITVGSGAAVPITVDSTNNTLDGIAKTINAANAGVTASVITDSTGSRLSILSSTSGTAGEVTVSPFTATAGATDPKLSFTEATKGIDASLQVDGIPITSSSNTVQNVIPGVTLNLQGTTTNPISLAVTPDTTTATNAIQSFVNNYNSIIQTINNQSTVTTGQAAPPLFGDSSMSIIQQQMFDAITYSTSSNGSIGSLRSLGITMNDDGTLSVDSGQLTSALSSNNAAVQNFFSSAGAGFADKFAASLQSMTDPTQGAISLEIQGNNSSVTSIQSQIADFEVRMTAVQAMLTTQYDQMNVTLQQMPLLLGQVNSQLNSLG